MIRDSKHSALRAFALASGLVAVPAAAQVPDLMPYQGYITDDAGAPYQGDVSLTFRMYQDGDSPGASWTENWDAVPVEDGVFYVYLGMFSPVGDALASGNARYLGVSIDGEGEASPRQRVGSVPYALMARDAQTLDGYAADDFASRGELGNYARWDVLGERGYATQQWVRDQGYTTQQWVIDQGYTTEEWVRGYVGDQGYLTADDIGEIDVDLTGYATEDWVRGYVGEQGYLRADALEGYASEEWVMTYVGEQGYLRADALEGYASEDWVRGYVGDQGYLRADALEGYATEQWVRDQGYTTEDWVRGYVGDQGYLRADALEGYATEQWVRDQGYLTGAALNGYATEQWVRDQDYVTGAALDARGYVTGAALDARGYVTGAALDARGYATTAYVDTLRADVSRTYVTNNALDARAYITADALDAYAPAATVAALSARIDTLEAALAQVVAASNAFLLGRSAQTSNGRFAFNGQTGIRAANEMCRASYANEPTAHFCSPDEVFRAISSGAYNAANGAAVDGVWTWAVTQTAMTNRGNNSLNGNCQNLMYNSADASSGTRLRVDLAYQSVGNGGGLTGDVVQIQQERGCGENMPVLCCR